MTSTQSEHVTFHVNPIDTKENVYILIPKELWELEGVSQAIKEAVDLTFLKDEGQLKQ